MTYYAHSSGNGRPAQTYEEHARGVRRKASNYAREMSSYLTCGSDLSPLLEVVGEFHDLGKLIPENQEVLSGRKQAGRLPQNHVDAGVLHFLRNMPGPAAMLVYSHHAGLPDFDRELNRGDEALRDPKSMEESSRILECLEHIHRNLIPPTNLAAFVMPQANRAVLLRLLLSCLADADHGDTGAHYGRYPAEDEMPSLRPHERLAQLDQHVGGLDKEGDRNNLRRQMYFACRDARIEQNISACDSPVGSGKTFSVMAHLLSQAEKRSLRRIFVVLPYTNIITQSVCDYRKSLVLPGENPIEVVAELHHRADFQDMGVQYLTALWRAPIIVTTAVAFFETLASCFPSTLRRLHALPGSAVFVDEAHAALPVHLLPLAWQWMDIYAREWNCYWILASGSLNRFWQIPEIVGDVEKTVVPEIVQDSMRQRLAHYEQTRIAYRSDLRPKTISQMTEWVSAHPGPRLLILNTIQSAAVLADALRQRFGREKVEYLSTALTPEDREKTLDRVKSRLADDGDRDWTLAATSCVEAGINLSFRTGFRELGSLLSLLQAAGRINREGKKTNAEIWSFCLADNAKLKNNPAIKNATEILRNYFERKITISPTLSTQSISEEIRLSSVESKFSELLRQERHCRFPYVEKDFKVITADTCIVVVSESVANALGQGKLDWIDLQKKTVHVSRFLVEKLRLPKILPNIYEWNRPYDNFLGYMAGVIEEKCFDGDILPS